MAKLCQAQVQLGLLGQLNQLTVIYCLVDLGYGVDVFLLI